MSLIRIISNRLGIFEHKSILEHLSLCEFVKTTVSEQGPIMKFQNRSCILSHSEWTEWLWKTVENCPVV